MKPQIEVKIGEHEDGTAIVTLVDCHDWREKLHDNCETVEDVIVYLLLSNQITNTAYDTLRPFADLPDASEWDELKDALVCYSTAIDQSHGLSDDQAEDMERVEVNIWDTISLIAYVDAVDRMIGRGSK